MADKKENRPIRDNGTVNTSNACVIDCYHDNTVSVHNQGFFDYSYYSCQFGDVEDMCMEQSITYDTLLCRVAGALFG